MIREVTNGIWVVAMIGATALPVNTPASSGNSNGWDVAHDAEKWVATQSPALVVMISANAALMASIRALWKRSLEESKHSREQSERMIVAMQRLKDSLEAVERFQCKAPSDKS